MSVPARVYGGLLVVFVLVGAWLILDVKQGYDKVMADVSRDAMQRSQIVGQSFRAQVLATDYVLQDVLGHIQDEDLVFPVANPRRGQQISQLLKAKADTVPGFFSMVIFNRDCVFTVTATGQNTGARSQATLCEERRMHQQPAPLVRFVPGTRAVSGQPVIVLSRNLRTPAGDFRGGVLGVIELNVAQQWLETLNLDAGDAVALMDDSGVLLARHPAVSAVTMPQSAGGQPWDDDGRERISGFSAVESFPFKVVYGFNKSRALQEWQWRAVQLGLGYLVLLTLAVVMARLQRTTQRQREALKNNNAQLHASEEHFRMLSENMADIVWRADEALRFTYVNAADQRLRGFAREEVLGTRLQDNCGPQGQTLLDALSRTPPAVVAKGGLALKHEVPMVHKSGGDVWVEMSIVPILGGDGRMVGYQGIGREINDRRQHEYQLMQAQKQLETQLSQAAQEKSELQEQASHDPLTGLHNRRFLNTAFPLELARAERNAKPVAVIMLDLDHFKKVNDQYSHAAGDEVLKALAKLLRQGARDSDLICRYGGEEFVAVMPNMSADQAVERVESWRLQLDAMQVAYGDSTIHVTLSAGVAVFPEHGKEVEVLLARADEMLYLSKLNGRNRVTVCTPV